MQRIDRTKALAFAAGYLEQAKLDEAQGRLDWAERSYAKRRKYQLQLVALRYPTAP